MSFLRRILSKLLAPVKAVLRSPGKLFSGGFSSFSVPARVALLVALFLIVYVIVWLLVQIFLNPDRPPDPLYRQRWLLIAALVLFIPVVVHRAVKLWLEGSQSLFGDIDYAWKEGLAALEEHDLDVNELPIFLVLGCRDWQQAEALMRASQQSLRVRSVPKDTEPFQWFASSEAIYLVCTKIGQLGRQVPVDAAGGMAGAVSEPGVQPDIRGTMIDPMGGNAPAPVEEAPQPAGGGAGNLPAHLMQTMVPGEAYADYEGPQASAPAPQRAELSEERNRLAYLCQLLRQARQPYCPINGIITLLPFGQIAGSQQQATQLQATVQEDLATIRDHLSIRCPVTALVSDMESEPGFMELVRRVGRAPAQTQRFGKGYSVSNPPVGERLVALGAHACYAFEFWTYDLFRRRGALTQSGNTRLYSLLCKIRGNVRECLKVVLESAYGYDDDSEPEHRPMLFSGCYFAAVGPTEDRQAFVASVFSKLQEQQEELEWTEEALAEDYRYLLGSRLAMAVNSLLVLALAAAGVYWWFIVDR